jgi:hypothetical protein
MFAVSSSRNKTGTPFGQKVLLHFYKPKNAFGLRYLPLTPSLSANYAENLFVPWPKKRASEKHFEKNLIHFEEFQNLIQFLLKLKLSALTLNHIHIRTSFNVSAFSSFN